MEALIAVPARPDAPARRSVGLTVLVPAYNEENSIADTVKSLQEQSVPVDEIVVIDDFSTDRTGDVARALGATVLRPPRNTGSKAGAQTFALAHVSTPYVMAIDADTVLDPRAVERILPAIREAGVAAACGFVLPRRVSTLWERGRYVEYLFAFTFYKPIQDHYARPLISSGCFSIYRTEVVRACGGWSNRTMAEDMDLTWTLYHRGHGVRFVPEAVSYPLEPHNYHFLSKQLRRWSHGFVQNVRLHWRAILHEPLLRSMVAVGLWDAAVASIAFLVAIPLLSLFVSPLFLLAYLFDLPAVLVPTLIAGWRRKEVGLVLASFPSFFVLRLVNGVFMLRALWCEFVLKRTLTVYEKGH
ncbi:MAG: glycosyltransferase [Planctomycetota bacterium]